MTDVDRECVVEFAEAGFAWFATSGIGLDEIADWCNQQSFEGGDQRYWILAASFLALDEWWATSDRMGGIAMHIYIALNESVKDYLKPVLDEPDPARGVQLAGLLSLRIQAAMDGRVPNTMYDHDDVIIIDDDDEDDGWRGPTFSFEQPEVLGSDESEK